MTGEGVFRDQRPKSNDANPGRSLFAKQYAPERDFLGDRWQPITCGEVLTEQHSAKCDFNLPLAAKAVESRLADLAQHEG